MTGYTALAVPGPTNMPFRVRQAMDVALEDHRAPDFPQLVLPLLADLKTVFQTRNGQVFIFPGSGTGGTGSPTVIRTCTVRTWASGRTGTS